MKPSNEENKKPEKPIRQKSCGRSRQTQNISTDWRSVK